MRPAILCKLKKGTVIDANPGFVDTFNWMVDFINNICGDGDNGGAGPITVDKTIDDRPVISGTFAGGGGGDTLLDEPFQYVVEESGGTTSRNVAGGEFWFDGEKHIITATLPITGSGSETAYLVCAGTCRLNSDNQPTYVYDWSFSTSLTPGTATAPDKVLNVKLYDFLDGKIVMDYRGQNLPVSSGSPNLECGDDSNIVFTPGTNGKTKIDVYYK